jgi:transcriptional regulator with XRE-family HTH domain
MSNRLLPQKHTSKQPRSRFSDEYGLLLTRLIAARKNAGVTQTEIASRLGKTQSHVSMCENREREISIIDLYRWCQAIDVKFSDFIADCQAEWELTQTVNN